MTEQTFFEELIDLVREKPHLYNPQSTDYKNASMRDNSWAEIGETLSVSADTAKKKWRNLRDTYMKLRAKLKKNERSGSAARSDTKWPFYENLRFVGDTFPEKRTFSNVPPITAEAKLEEGPSTAGAAREDLSADEESARGADQTTSQAGPPLKGPSSKRPKSESVDREILNFLKSIAKEEDDVNEAFSKTVALELKSLPKEKQAHARFKISELLFSFHNDV